MQMYRRSTSALPKNRNVIRITPKSLNIFPNPRQTHPLILEAHVPMNSNVRKTQKSQRPQSVVDRNDHHALLDQMLGAIHWRLGTSGDEATAMEPHHNRKLGGFARWFRRQTGREHVQVEAVLGHLIVWQVVVHRETSWGILGTVQRGKGQLG